MAMIITQASLFKSTTKTLGSQRCDSHNKCIHSLYIFATVLGSRGNDGCPKWTTGDLERGGERNAKSFQFIFCYIWNWVVGKFAQRGMLFAVRKGMKPKCIKAEEEGEPFSGAENREGPFSVTMHWMFITEHRTCQWDFKDRSLVLLYNVTSVKIKLHMVKTVGNKFSGFLVILDSGDWLMTLIWSSS